MSYSAEIIPNEHSLYRNVPNTRLKRDGNPTPGAFSIKGSGMSTNWEKYITPLNSFLQLPNNLQTGGGIIKLKVEDIKKINDLCVKHTPRKHNRAHTDVKGDVNDTKIRIKLLEISKFINQNELS